MWRGREKAKGQTGKDIPVGVYSPDTRSSVSWMRPKPGTPWFPLWVSGIQMLEPLPAVSQGVRLQEAESSRAGHLCPKQCLNCCA